MPFMPISHAEEIARSAAHAAWVGAGASTFASVVALTVALWGARREERNRKRLAKDQEVAFAFGMVGAFEMTKPLVVAARVEPTGEAPLRRFADVVDHAIMIADAALAIRIFDMQMLRDGFLVRGALNRLRGLQQDHPGAAVQNAAILAALDPVLEGLLDADDRFFRRLPAITEIQGISGRTPLR